MIKQTLIFTALLLGASTLPAAAAIGEWVDGGHVRLRLVATSPASDGTMNGAVQIALEPGWKTYWRSPGDAGIPPKFDFSASTNAGKVSENYPAPTRDDDGFAATNVYHDRVILPITLKAGDAAKPVDLSLTADLGVCAEVCIPVNVTVSLTVPPKEHDPIAADLIESARASIPGPGRPGSFEIESIKRVGGTDLKPTFEVATTVSDADESVLFVETPADWYPAPPAVSSTSGSEVRFRFDVDRKGSKTPITGAEIRLTLTEDADSTTRAFKLDASKSSP